MTNQQLLQRIDRLGEYAATALRCAAEMNRRYMARDGSNFDGNLASTFRGNAKCYNEAAGLFALDLRIAEFIDREFRPADERFVVQASACPRGCVRQNAADLPAHIEDILQSFNDAPGFTREAVAIR